VGNVEKFRSREGLIESKGYGIIGIVKKLGVALAIGLALLIALSKGAFTRQNSANPKTWKLKKIAFESSTFGFIMTGPVKGSKTIVPNQGHISVIVAPDSEPILLAEGQAPAWSPDGKQLAFCTVEMGKSGHGQIQIINADGSGESQLTNVRDGACHPDWSPDGEKIAFTVYDGKAPKIATIGKDGAYYRSIADGYGPRWSLDGKLLLFFRDLNSRGTKRAIWIVNADGTGARKVFEENNLPRTWATGGQARFFGDNRIIFSSDRGNAWSIFRVNLDGTNVESFAENPEYDLLDPCLSPDGTQLVVQGVTRQLMSGKGSGGEIVMLLLDLRTNQWTRLQYGVYPSVVWEKNDAPNNAPAKESVGPSTTNQSLITHGRARYLANKCDECHGANGEGGGDGPDLIGTRLNAEEISKFLEKPSPDAYMKGMPNIPVNHPDHQALVAYVLSLKRPSNPN